MDRRKQLADRLLHSIELEDEMLPLESLIEIAGDHRILIENHKGVTQYSCEKICVKLNRGLVCINGEEMRLAVMKKDKLVICGKITAVHLAGVEI